MSKRLKENVEIELSAITVQRRLRRLRPEMVAMLADSFQRCGLQIESIIVRPRRRGGYWLVAGWHRLEAAKQLGWTSIRCDVWAMTVNEAQVMEIDDNLVAPLSPAERLLHSDRRDELIACGDADGD
jgi:ParB family chromosome partitioning protein